METPPEWGTVCKLHIFHVSKISEQRTKNTLYSNEMEAMLVETLCRNQALDLAHYHPPVKTVLGKKERICRGNYFNRGVGGPATMQHNDNDKWQKLSHDLN